MWVCKVVVSTCFLQIAFASGPSPPSAAPEHCEGWASDGSHKVGDCLSFTAGGETYMSNHCRYDYLHNQSWCAVSSSDWGICQGSCQNDFKECTFGTREGDGNVYFLSHTSLNFADAGNACEAQGCRLAHADEAQTYEIIKSYLDKIAIYHNQPKFWIGITYNQADNEVHWAYNNEKFTFDEIRHNDKDCAILKADVPGQILKGIDNIECSNERHFLCQCLSLDECPSYERQSSGHHGYFEEWGSWSSCQKQDQPSPGPPGSASPPVGARRRRQVEQFEQRRERSCHNFWSPNHSGATCDGSSSETRICSESQEGLTCVGNHGCCTSESKCVERDGPCGSNDDCQEGLECIADKTTCSFDTCCYTLWSDWELSNNCSLGLENAPEAETYYMRYNRTCRVPSICGSSTEHERFEACEKVDGGWSSHYGDWQACDSSTCTKTRSRSCTNPEPKYGGEPCQGAMSEVRFCDECDLASNCGFQFGFYDRPTNIQLIEDIESLEQCQEHCQENDECKVITMVIPESGNAGLCYLLPEQANPVEGGSAERSFSGPKYCSVNGGWSNFTEWSACSDNCTSYRTRQCNNPQPLHGGSNCTGNDLESRYCIDCQLAKDCMKLGAYGEDDTLNTFDFDEAPTVSNCQSRCQESEKCLGFVMNQMEEKCILKTVIFENVTVEGETLISGPKHCPLDGNWTDFTLWTACQNGQRKGFRYCTNPEPDHGGKDCQGSNFIYENCSVDSSTSILKCSQLQYHSLETQ